MSGSASKEVPFPVSSLRRVGLALVILAGGLCHVAAGCQKERPLSGLELQALKREAIQDHRGELTSEQESLVGSIQVRTRAEFERKLQGVLAGELRVQGAAGKVPNQ